MTKAATLVIRGALRGLAIIIGVAALAWCLVEVAPGSAAERAARARGVLPSIDSPERERIYQEVVADMEVAYRLNRGFGPRLVGYLVDLPTGELGRSWRDDRPVTALIFSRAAPTFSLLAAALLVALFAGTWLARWQVSTGTRDASNLGRAVATFALAAPPVWLGVVVLGVFAPSPAGVAAFVGATACLALAPAASMYRHLRVALSDGARAPWSQSLRAQGMSESRLVGVYAMRTVRPLHGVLAVNVTGYLLGATVVIERIFGIRGLGDLLLDAAVRGDAPVVVGISVVFASVMAVMLVVADTLRRRPEADGDSR